MYVNNIIINIMLYFMLCHRYRKIYFRVLAMCVASQPRPALAKAKPQRNCILGSHAVTSSDVTMGLNRLAPVVTRRKTLNFGSRYHGVGMQPIE